MPLTQQGQAQLRKQQSSKEVETMKKKLPGFMKEMGDLKGYRDMLAELENQLYADRRLFEEELG